MIIDTHTHLYLDEFQPTPEDAVRRAIDAGVEKMIFPNVDLSTIEPMKRLQAAFPSNVAMAMGFPYLMMREPQGISRRAILCPRGISSSAVMPIPSAE